MRKEYYHVRWWDIGRYACVKMVGDAFDITAVYYLEVNGQYTTCDCPSASFHEGPCKHVRLLEKFKADGKVSRRVVFDIFNKEYVEV